jgi:hypothetical protein
MAGRRTLEGSGRHLEGREVASAGDLRGGGCAEQQASVVKEALGIGISREN